VSHSKERKEKICLNCGAAIYGRYCHSCGQENIEPKETFWHLLTHFAYDITHFDGKFFSTIKYLLFRPGYLSHEYLKGRRASYLHPIKLYVFTSAFFFLIFFSFYNDLGVQSSHPSNNAADIIHELKEEKAYQEKRLLNKSLSPKKTENIKAKIVLLDSDINVLTVDTTKKNMLLSEADDFPEISSSKSSYHYKSFKEYDSIQASLPKEKRDGWISRAFEKTEIKKKQKFGNNNKAYFESLGDNFIHHIPQLLFTSLPLIALVLQLLYRRRKQFYYLNHAIFTIHLYCGTFIIILLRLWTDSIFGWFHAAVPSFIGWIFMLATLFYWYKSFRNFYEQRRGKTILKYILLLLSALVLTVFLFLVFGIFSIFSI
jgi:hypothetical protein